MEQICIKILLQAIKIWQKQFRACTFDFNMAMKKER